VTDRSQAISLVEAALKSGRIVQADHDMRLDQIKNSSSQQEIDLAVRDLQMSTPVAATAGATMTTTATPTATPTSTPTQPWPLVNYGPQQGQAAGAAGDLTQITKTGGKALGGIIGLVVLISVIVPIVGVVIGLVSAKDTFDDIDFGQPVDETTYLPGQQPGEDGVNVHTLEGWESLLAAVDETTGSTTVFDATLYPRYAVVSVPEGPRGKRYRNFYWDGRELAEQSFKSTTDDPRIDLASFDASVWITLLEDVRGRVEDPTSWYVTIGSDPTTNEPRLAVYASNDYSEGAYLLATADGTVTYENAYP
jgi:hypothetical protein